MLSLTVDALRGGLWGFKINTGTPIWIQKQMLHDRANAQAHQRNNTSTRKQTILHSPQALSHSIISLISLCICFVVKCLFLDPNWCTGINFLSLVLFLSGNILFFQVFWRILEAVVLVCKMQFGVGLCVV